MDTGLKQSHVWLVTFSHIEKYSYNKLNIYEDKKFEEEIVNSKLDLFIKVSQNYRFWSW